MNNQILTFTLAGIISIAGFTVSGQENKDAKNARKDIADAQKDIIEAQKELREAKIDSAADYEKFKKDAEINISENEKKIADLKISTGAWFPEWEGRKH